MDLESIRLLLKVVELGSVQGAARQLGMARSMLRRRLLDLETQTGCELFVTNASGVALTSAGAVIAAEGRELLAHASRMLAAASAADTRPEGVLRLIIPTGMPDVARLQLLQAQLATAPQMRVRERESADPLSLLHEPFDLLFHFGAAATTGEWFSRILRRFLLVPVASQAYLDAHGRPTSPSDLARHRLLGWRRPGEDPLVWPLLDGGTLPVEPVLVSDNGQLLHRAAQEGIGIVLGSTDPTMLQRPDAPSLLPILDDVIGVEVTIRVLSPLPMHIDPRVRALVATIQEFLSNLEA